MRKELKRYKVDARVSWSGTGCIQGKHTYEKILGDFMYDEFLKAKEKEWEDFRSHVTDWEIKNI